jgi:hypothetical protein
METKLTETKADKVKAFNTILGSFLEQTSPLVGTTYYSRFKKLILVNAPLPIKCASDHLINYKEQIMSKDEAYFNDPVDISTKIKNVSNSSSIISELPSIIDYGSESIITEILRLKDIYYKLNTDSRDNVWLILQALLQLCIEYKQM